MLGAGYRVLVLRAGVKHASAGRSRPDLNQAGAKEQASAGGESPQATGCAQRGRTRVRPSEVIIGAEDWNRTSDTSIFSAVLYRLSYLGTATRRSAEP